MCSTRLCQVLLRCAPTPEAWLIVLRHKATNSNRHPEALGAHLCAPSLEGVTAPIRAASFEARAQSVAGLVIVILARGHLRMTARDRATAEICDAVQLTKHGARRGRGLGETAGRRPRIC